MYKKCISCSNKVVNRIHSHKSTKGLQVDFSKGNSMFQKSAAVIPGGGQTMSKRPENYAPGCVPKMLMRGAGARVWDVDGNEFIDTIGALGPVTLGYSYPAVDDAIARQLRQGIVFSFSHPLELEVAEKLVATAPGADWARFFKTGAEATSAAVRIARAATGRELIVSSGYHGWHDTWTAERTGGAADGVPTGMKNWIAPFTFGLSEGDNCLANVMAQHRGQVAAIVMEPVLYDRVDVKDHLEEARRLADEHGALLVFDEIVSGFRVARGGAGEKYEVQPDLACWAKGIANGMPLAAVTGRKDLHELTGRLMISSTYGGETLSLAAASACMDIYANHDVIGHTTEQGQRLLTMMQDAANSNGLHMRFGGHPMMGGYLMGYPDATLNNDLVTLFLQEMAARGVLIRRNGLIFVSYSFGTAEVDAVAVAAAEAMDVMANAVHDGDVGRFIKGDREAVSGFSVR